MAADGKDIVARFDVGGLGKAQRLDSGMLRVEGHLTKVGVFSYPQPDGTIRRELRLPEEVFRADSLTSFHMVPFTNNHPPALLSADDARRYQVGSVGENVRADGDLVAAPIMVTDAATIKEIEGGKTLLSCGYACRLDFQPGTWRGQRYDAIQRDIRGNHVALVARARAGDDARLRMDGKGEAPGCMLPVESPNEEQPKMKIKLDGIEVEVNDANQAAVQAAIDRGSTEKARADAATTARDQVQAKLDGETKARQDAEALTTPAAIQRRVNDRVALEILARQSLGTTAKLDGLTDLDVKRQVIAKLSPEAKMDGQSEAYIVARFDVETERAAKKPAPIDQARGNLGGAPAPRLDAAPDPDKARDAMIAQRQNAYKPAEGGK